MLNSIFISSTTHASMLSVPVGLIVPERHRAADARFNVIEADGLEYLANHQNSAWQQFIDV